MRRSLSCRPVLSAPTASRRSSASSPGPSPASRCRKKSRWFKRLRRLFFRHARDKPGHDGTPWYAQSPGAHQPDGIVALEEIEQEPQSLGLCTGKLRIARKDEPRLVARRLQQQLVLGQACDAEGGEPALLCAEHLASAAQAQVLFGDDEAVFGPPHDRQPLARRLRKGLAIEQNAGGLLRATPDASAQLMKLGEPEALGMLYDHDRGIRHVDPDLDDRG